MSWTTPLTALPHLSDEAVAAFADGVLSGQARQRAQSHMANCGECSEAVYGQRSASAMLRSASAPSVPTGLLDRLRELPITAELPMIRFPSGLSADGQPMFAAFTGPNSGADVGPAAYGPSAFGSTVFVPPAFGPTALVAPAFGQTAIGQPAIGQTAFGPTALVPHELGDPTAIGPTPFRTAPLAPAWPVPPASAPILPPIPDRVASPRPDLPSRPAATGHPRRRVSSRAGLGAAAIAVVAVGMLASTAAAAGGVTTTGRPAAPSARPSSPFVEAPPVGQAQPALLTFIPSPR